MAVKHLSDEEIQAYLDGDRTVDAAGIADHLRQCAECRRVCDEYSVLYVALADNSRVAVPTPSGSRAAADWVDAFVGGWAVAVALAVSAGILVRIGDFGPDAGRASRAFWQLLCRAFEMPASLADAAAPAGQAAWEVVAAGLVLCAVLVLDSLLLSPRLAGTRPARLDSGLGRDAAYRGYSG